MRPALAGPHIPPRRLLVTYLIVGGLTALFVMRLYQLQVLQGEDFTELAEENRLTNVYPPAPRGVIYDRNDYQLVRNIPSFNVLVTPAFLPDSPAEVEATYQVLSNLTGVPVDQGGPPAARCVAGRGIRQLVEEGATIRPFESWPIACDVPERVARILRERQMDLPGVTVEAVPVRDYTTGDLTAAVIGYLGPIPEAFAEEFALLGFQTDRDKVGYVGIEGAYQTELAGQNGLKVVVEDVAHQHLFELGEVRQPIPGNNLRLTLDTRLQAAAATALSNRIEFLNRFAGEVRAPLGVVIAMNPQTGEILAMVTLPTYENNRMARFIPADYYNQLIADERGKPLINHAVSSEFPPGSTFKMATAIGILNEGVVTPGETIFDPGVITIANRYFPNDPGRAREFVCWKRDGHGAVDFLHGVAFSCNIYFYSVGGGYPGEVQDDGLGIGRIGWYARALGYGEPLGIDLPGEEDGLIPDPDWKRINLGESWSTGDTYNATTGQGFVLATPLQVLTSIATLANGGRVMQPHLVSQILDGEGNVVREFGPQVLWDIGDGQLTHPSDWIVEPWVIRLAQQAMHLVTTEGTAFGYGDLDDISSAGKTGTGEFCDAFARSRNLCNPGNWPTHAWYVGYAPFENPEIAVIAFVYNGGEGAITSAPIVKQVLEAYFALKAIDTAGSP